MNKSIKKPLVQNRRRWILVWPGAPFMPLLKIMGFFCYHAHLCIFINIIWDFKILKNQRFLWISLAPIITTKGIVQKKLKMQIFSKFAKTHPPLQNVHFSNIFFWFFVDLSKKKFNKCKLWGRPPPPPPFGYSLQFEFLFFRTLPSWQNFLMAGRLNNKRSDNFFIETVD